jgi:tetratricopeptide (TPR) repeat protein
MRQVPLWKDSLTLWKHTLAITPGNFTGHCSYGAALLDAARIEGTDQVDPVRVEEAAQRFLLARDSKPTHGLPHYYLGVARLAQKKLAEAEDHVRTALAIDPKSALTHWLLGEILAARGQTDRAEEHFTEARRIEPNNPRFRP